MAIKILIERRIEPGQEGNLREAMNGIRPRVTQARGFVSGETLRSVDDPSFHLVISAWKSVEDWQTWMNSAERKAFQEKMAALLVEPEKISAYQTDTFVDVRGGMVATLKEAIGVTG
jgi:heme-degrading monooxygenase HmoA